MYNLSDEQVDYILLDISAKGVKMPGLQQSLLDHICCLVEENLEADGDFEQFYSNAICKFYTSELREIEIETKFLLTFKYYFKMKKAMIIFGCLSAATFIMGSLFKIMHWPGAAVLLVLATFGLCFVFLPLFCALKLKEVNAGRDKIAY
jgi:hypothetical protein